MGYTHYFPQKRAFTVCEWLSITNDVKVLFKGTDILFDGHGEGTPKVTNDKILFNGDASQDLAYESFLVTKEMYVEYNFCKTIRKPYDDYVTAVLCIINHHAKGALEITSDGRVTEWQKGLKLAQEVAPDAKIPGGVKEPIDF